MGAPGTSPGPYAIVPVRHLGDPAYAVKDDDGDLIAVGCLLRDALQFAASGALHDALEGLLFTVRARGVADLPVFDDDPALAEARAALALARGETPSDTGEKA